MKSVRERIILRVESTFGWEPPLRDASLVDTRVLVNVESMFGLYHREVDPKDFVNLRDVNPDVVQVLVNVVNLDVNPVYVLVVSLPYVDPVDVRAFLGVGSMSRMDLLQERRDTVVVVPVEVLLKQKEAIALVSHPLDVVEVHLVQRSLHGRERIPLLDVVRVDVDHVHVDLVLVV